MKRIELALCIVAALAIALVTLSEAKSIPKDDEQAVGETRKSLKKGGGKFDPADAEDASDYLDGEEELIKTTKKSDDKAASRSGELSTSEPVEESAKSSKKGPSSKASKKKKKKANKVPPMPTEKPDEEEAEDKESSADRNLENSASDSESDFESESDSGSDSEEGSRFVRPPRQPRPRAFLNKKYIPRTPRLNG